jgi:hypothetical protein
MGYAITYDHIFAVRDDAARLVAESQSVLQFASTIAKAFVGDDGQPSPATFKSGRPMPWGEHLLLFAESLLELREHLDDATVPEGELVEWLEANQSDLTILGVKQASRVRLAHGLAKAVFASLGSDVRHDSLLASLVRVSFFFSSRALLLISVRTCALVSVVLELSGSNMVYVLHAQGAAAGR